MRKISLFFMVLLILNTVPVAFATDVTYQFGEESINTTWTTVTFDEAFSNTPLVFAEIQTENGSHAVQVDLRNVTMTSFQIRLEEDRGRNRGWLDGWHYYEDVNWFAIDPTEYTANDGVEVGSVNYKQLLRSNWGSVIFSETFSDTPLVLALIQTENGTDTVRADIRNLTSTGFEFRLEEDRGRSSTVNSWDGWHTTETVGYIAIDPALDLSPWNILFNTGETTSSWATVCFESDCSDVFVDTPSV
ncbi:MAG: calx-beta protein, partial [uncultured bacterium]